MKSKDYSKILKSKQSFEAGYIWLQRRVPEKYREEVLKDFPYPEVPCNGCNECCRGPRELKLELDDWGKYLTYIKDGQVYLRRKDNEDCVYFDGYCRIYNERPKTCRKFDCRTLLGERGVPARIIKAALKIKDKK